MKQASKPAAAKEPVPSCPAELVGTRSTAVLCQEEVTSEELRVDAKVSVVCNLVPQQ